MVQTFLVHPDYSTSARLLDRRRLNKQKVEAMQILNLLEDLAFLAKQFQLPQPERSAWHQWIRDIIQAYDQLPYRYLQLKTTKFTLTAHDHTIIETYHLTTTGYTPVPVNVAETIRQYKQRSIRVITLKYATHPIVKMWLGYDNSLREYINAHIDAWVELGKNNNMMRYSVSPGQPRPPWTLDPKLHQNHRAALIAKELDRNEPTWYALKPEFVAEQGKFTDYIWV
jgi:hypothetical protein